MKSQWHDVHGSVKLVPILYLFYIHFQAYEGLKWFVCLGDTLNMPDSITGLTILAAGTSLPEAVSSVLVTKQGKCLLNYYICKVYIYMLFIFNYENTRLSCTYFIFGGD